MYKQTFTGYRRAIASDFRTIDFINVGIEVPDIYRDTIVKFDIAINIGFNPLGLPGWGEFAFKFNETVNLSFNKSSQFNGLSNINIKAGDPEQLKQFQTKTIVFNPFEAGEGSGIDDPNFPFLEASQNLEVLNLINSEFSVQEFAAVGGFINTKELFSSPFVVAVNGFSDNLVHSSGSPITSLSEVPIYYSVNVTVEATEPDLI